MCVYLGRFEKKAPNKEKEYCIMAFFGQDLHFEGIIYLSIQYEYFFAILNSVIIYAFLYFDYYVIISYFIVDDRF